MFLISVTEKVNYVRINNNNNDNNYDSNTMMMIIIYPKIDIIHKQTFIVESMYCGHGGGKTRQLFFLQNIIIIQRLNISPVHQGESKTKNKQTDFMVYYEK